MIRKDNSKAGELKVTVTGTVERTKRRGTSIQLNHCFFTFVSLGSRVTTADSSITVPRSTGPSTSSGIADTDFLTNGIQPKINSANINTGSKNRDTLITQPSVDIRRSSADEEPLPTGWEVRHDANGRSYYGNSLTISR